MAPFPVDPQWGRSLAAHFATVIVLASCMARNFSPTVLDPKTVAFYRGACGPSGGDLKDKPAFPPKPVLAAP